MIEPTENNNETPHIGSLLKEYRKIANMTQADVATAMGTSQQSICRLEAGKVTNPGYLTIVQFMKAIGYEAKLCAKPLLPSGTKRYLDNSYTKLTK